MDIRECFCSQYYASLEMLQQAVVKCPDSLWNDMNNKNKFWHIAYHTLFYTHMYLQEHEKTFIPWVKHRNQYQFMGSVPWPPYERPKIEEPYNKSDVSEFLLVCQNEIELKLPATDMSTPSGFHWLPFTKFELQLYNIRHIQHHTGQLFGRLGMQSDVKLQWIFSKNTAK